MWPVCGKGTTRIHCFLCVRTPGAATHAHTRRRVKEHGGMLNVKQRDWWGVQSSTKDTISSCMFQVADDGSGNGGAGFLLFRGPLSLWILARDQQGQGGTGRPLSLYFGSPFLTDKWRSQQRKKQTPGGYSSISVLLVLVSGWRSFCVNVI